MLHGPYPLLRLHHPLLSFVGERGCDDPDRQDTQIFTDLGNNGCTSRAGAAAHARSDKGHFSIDLEDRFDLLQALLRRLPANVRICAGPQSLGEMGPELYLVGHTALSDRLRIGITDNEIHPFNVLAEHVVHCIAAAATHTNDFDNG